MNVLLIIALCAAVVFAARLTDFLIGNRGNRWLKEHLIYNSWYALETFSPLVIFRSAARRFERITKVAFGDKLISLRAYLVSLSIGFLLAALLLSLGHPISFQQQAEERISQQLRYCDSSPTPQRCSPIMVRMSPSDLHSISYAECVATFGQFEGGCMVLDAPREGFGRSWWTIFLTVYLVVNPPFDFASFAVTRYFAALIARSGRLLTALTLWFFDLLLSFCIATVTFYVVSILYMVASPGTFPKTWPILEALSTAEFVPFVGYLITSKGYDMAVTAAATGLVPALIHLLFFIIFLALALAEVARRGLSFLLERFDESDERPFTIIATVLAAIIGLLAASRALLQG